MTVPDDKVNRAIVNLETDSNFIVIKNWIKQRTEKHAVAAIEEDNDTPSKKLAGRALEGKELIEYFENARGNLSRREE